MKPVWIVFCLALCIFGALSADGFALTVGSPYKPGSVMIFPLIDISGGADTVITITNGFYQGVNVACRWKDTSGNQGGPVFFVGPNATVWFRVKSGGGSSGMDLSMTEKGELKCWAVNDAGNEQISWNSLQGIAQVFNSTSVWGYSSWNFAANKQRGESVGTAGRINLSGMQNEYDAMPKYLQFIIPGTVTQAKLTLALGEQDLTQDAQSIYSKAKFAYSRGGTSGQQCIQDWVQTSISGSVLGSFKVQGIASTVCDNQFNKAPGTTQNSPLLGVLEAHMGTFVFGIMPVGVGIDGSGYILWEAEGQGAEANNR
jgi:hypothetical protein